MLGTLDLMNQERHVILAVNIAAFAIEVIRIFNLVLDHRLLSLEGPITVVVGASELAVHGV